MTLSEFFAPTLKGNFDMLMMALADLSDADLLVRPVAGANHANWQMGHLVNAETGIMNGCGAKMPELPAGFKERYSREAAKVDDAEQFATKAELVALLEKARNAAIAWVKTATPAQLEAKGPIELTPRVANAVDLLSQHYAMHLGQIQVLRRKLGKPILF